MLEVPLGQIDVGDDRAVPGELREVGSHAAADLEHLLPGVARELHHLAASTGRKRRTGSARPPRNHSSDWGCAAAGRFRTDRIVVPLVLYLILVRVPGFHPAASRGRVGSAGRERPQPFDVPLPRIVIRHRLSRVAAERAAHVRTSRQADDAVDELVDVARACTGPSADRPPSGRRRDRSPTRSAGDSTSPICSRSLATMPPPIAMYSKILVGDPKNLPSTMWRVVRRHVDVARLQQLRAVGLRHPADSADAGAEAVALDLGVELRLVRAVADDEELRIRRRPRRSAESPPPARRCRASRRTCR